MQIDGDRAQGWLRGALAEAAERDAYLWDINVSERSRVGRVHLYLARRVEREAGRLHVDVEFDRRGTGQKGLARAGHTRGIPDIIVHERGDALGNNLLVVECKKGYSAIGPGSDDEEKMRAWLDQYDYRLGALVAFGPTPRSGQPQMIAPRIIWIWPDGRMQQEDVTV